MINRDFNLPVIFNQGSDELFSRFNGLFDHMFDNFLPDFKPFVVNKDSLRSSSYPKLDIRYDGKDLVIEAALPFVKQEDVEVTLDDAILTIKGEVMEEHKIDKSNFYCAELARRRFSRSIDLGSELYEKWANQPSSTAEEGFDVEAVLKDGVLKIVLPNYLPEEEKKPPPKKVLIRSE